MQTEENAAEEFVAGEADHAGRLDQFLVSRVPRLSRARLQALIRSGQVWLNGAGAKPNTRLKAGDLVVLREPQPARTETLPEEIPLKILYEDADLIVVNKMPGMVVHPAAGNWAGTLVNALLHHCGALSSVGGEQRPGIVHRLDKDTSGCLVAAKNDLSHRSLARQFAGREVRKVYLALAAGEFSRKSGTVEAPIGRHPVDRKRMTVVSAGGGRPARTDWRVLGQAGGGTLVECTLHTGRTHQIRVHLRHLGHGLLGDEVYGRRAGYARQMLHAWKLGFVHPRTGERLGLVSPIPADFLEAGVPADPGETV